MERVGWCFLECVHRVWERVDFLFVGKGGLCGCVDGWGVGEDGYTGTRLKMYNQPVFKEYPEIYLLRQIIALYIGILLRWIVFTTIKEK